MSTSKRVESATEFLKSLEDPSVTSDVMVDRMDTEVLQVITNYSELILKVKDKTKVNERELLTCSMILGYLLKGHIDRFELEESLKKRN